MYNINIPILCDYQKVVTKSKNIERETAMKTKHFSFVCINLSLKFVYTYLYMDFVKKKLDFLTKPHS